MMRRCRVTAEKCLNVLPCKNVFLKGLLKGSNHEKNVGRKSRDTLPLSSVADPERFDMDPDPTFHADVDPDPAPDPKLNKNSSKSSPILSKIVPNLLCVIFSVTMRKEG